MNTMCRGVVAIHHDQSRAQLVTKYETRIEESKPHDAKLRVSSPAWPWNDRELRDNIVSAAMRRQLLMLFEVLHGLFHANVDALSDNLRSICQYWCSANASQIYLSYPVILKLVNLYSPMGPC